MIHTKYRPDIDGLRAVAILSVVGFHAFPSIFKGGFVGVDIFFVISGYLITTIILGNLEYKSFDYRNFYSRRIKRIFPALLLVIATTMILGWFLLFPNEFQQLGKHTASGIGFISNFILWGEAGYFDNSSETKPFLHLWSLGIEEQFYIFWPLLLGLIWKYKINPLKIVISIAVMSFSLGIYSLLTSSSESSFYLPYNRFWELMIGGVLAYMKLHLKDGFSLGKFNSNALSILGCLFILVALVRINKSSLFPGLWALLPTIGAFLIILSPNSWINHNILSSRVFTYLGLVSYPLYLWHWPLLSFSYILNWTSHKEKIICVTLSLILAILTYEYLEKKIKNNTQTIYTLIGLSVFLFLVGLFAFGGIYNPRNNSEHIQLYMEAVNDWEYPDGLTRSMLNDKYRIYIKHGAKEKVLFYGDSHIEQYSPRVVKLIDENPKTAKTVIFATSGGCPPIPNVFEDEHPECTAGFRNTVMDYALSDEIDSVVIGASWRYLIKNEKPSTYRYYYLKNGEKKYFDEDGIEYAYKSLERLIRTLSKNKKVYLVIDNPGGENYDPKTYYEGSRISGLADKKISYQKYGEKEQNIRLRLIEIANKTNALVIDPIKHFCRNDLCKTVMDDGKPIYKDNGHIRPFYVKKYIDYMDEAILK